jgi:hypothetical protein
LFERVKKLALPTREAAVKAEEKRNATLIGKRGNQHHANFLKRWWLLSYPRPELMKKLKTIPRYVSCCLVTKRPIFEFISSEIHPNVQLVVFPMADDYSFGILQSGIHWAWFTAKCSTLTERFRYTSDTVFDTFPWPQSPPLKQIRAVADTACALRAVRRETMRKNGCSLRELYKTLETPGTNKLHDAQDALDVAVRVAYDMKPDEDILAFLLKLNLELAEKEKKGQSITPPGLPAFVEKSENFVSEDCVQITNA